MSRLDYIAARLRGVQLGLPGVPSFDRKYLTPNESERMAEAVIELDTTPGDKAESGTGDTRLPLSVKVLELAKEFDETVAQIRDVTGDYEDGAEYENAAERLRALVSTDDANSLEQVKNRAAADALVHAVEKHSAEFYSIPFRVDAVSVENLTTLAGVYRNKERS